jgi:nicotinate dehydrogenase subunit B
MVVNGRRHPARATAQLMTVLRDQLGLTGAKPGCDEGACGACTVLLGGAPIRSCQSTVGTVAGGQLTTIEGLSWAGGPAEAGLTAVQRAFAEESAAQCGYCTPGFVLAITALLAREPDPDEGVVDEALAGHICRCGGYPRIRRAIRRAVELAAAGIPLLPGEGSASAGSTGPGSTGPGAAGPGSRRGQAGRWGPPEPGRAAYRPPRPWDLTEPTDCDWFGALGDGLMVVLAPAGESPWTTAPGAWLHIGPAGVVTAFTGKVDVGQDNATALRLLVAEELEVEFSQVLLAMGDTDVCPHDRGTFGSRSMPDAGSVLRRAAACARDLGPVEPGARRIEVVTGDPVLRDPATWTEAGREHRAPAVVAAVTGRCHFASDLSLPGLAHGAVLRPPVPGAELRSLDATVLSDWPDVRLIAADGVTGVVGSDLAAARGALAALAQSARWELPDAPDDDDLSDYLRAHLTTPAPDARDGVFKQQAGSAATALEVAAVRSEATYTAAYITPAALETRVALAEWSRDGRLTVWTGTQTPFPVRAQVAAATEVDEGQVRIIVPPTGGAFGGKHPAQVAIEAAVLARAAGCPVRIAWSRAEEFTAGGLRRAAVIDVAAGASAAGELSGWTFLDINAGSAGIASPYRLADYRLEYSPAHSPLQQGSYRGLAATANNFARESAIDELADGLGIDPVEFRLRNLADERVAAVLRAVAERIGWDARTRDRGREPSGTAIGWGIACGIEKEGRIATAVRVAVGPDRQVLVTWLVSGYECGAIVNPRAVRAQVEGAAVMALGGALFEAVTFAGGVITNAAFSRYRVPRIADVPPIEVVLLDRPDLPSVGAGETPMIAVAPAIAAAIFDATGRRLRSLPLTW